MQKSFSVVEDDPALIEEDTWKDGKNKISSPQNNSDLSDSEENSNSPKRSMKPRALLDQRAESFSNPDNVNRLAATLMDPVRKLTSAGPGPSKLKAASEKQMKLLNRMSSDTEDDSDNEQENKIPGEYDPKLYEDLEVDEECKDVFQYIIKYIPQQLNLDYKFKPFIPEFLPAVGDIDAFLKVIPPEKTLNEDKFDEKSLKLGLTVLDEPAANQSEPALLHLQLRATSVNPGQRNQGNVVIKKVENLEKNAKVIDKWIKDVSDLHKSKSSPVVRYSEPMPDLDDLMQQWPEDMEASLKEKGFPKSENMSLSQYVDTVCDVFKIPVAKKKIQSLHLLFCLYASIKQTQLYQASAGSSEKKTGYQLSRKEADQLVLD